MVTANKLEFIQRFEDLIVYIHAANEKILAGEACDLATLDKTVEALCREVTNSDPAIARDVQPLMAEVISGLNELENNLTELTK